MKNRHQLSNQDSVTKTINALKRHGITAEIMGTVVKARGGILVFLAVLFVSGSLLTGCTSGTSSRGTASPQKNTPPVVTTALPANPKAFTVTGSNYSFDLKEIRVKKGDTVQIIFRNAEGFHDWRVDEFNAFTKQIGAGQSDTVTFTADKVGTFEYYCSVGQHRAMGMVGKLIVE